MINDFFFSITDFIFCENAPEKSDIILVPGNRDLEMMAKEAVDLYHAGYAKKIVFSGSKNIHHDESNPTEAHCLRTLATQFGVPIEDIIIEPRAKHTFQNALFTKRKLDKLNISISSAVLVCKGFHSRRAFLSYQSVFGPKVHFSARVIPGSENILPDNWLQDPKKRDIVLGEIAKIGNYLKKHLIQIEQSTSLSIFQKYSRNPFFHKKRLLFQKSSSEYFLIKKNMLQKNIPKKYQKIVHFSLDDIFQAGFFRNFLKHISPQDNLGSLNTIDSLKKVTTSLVDWDIPTLLRLWEAYVQVNSGEAMSKMKYLKEHNFFCILSGYEYDAFLEVVRKVIGIPLCYGTMLEYSHNICNGEVSIPSYFFDPDGAGVNPRNVVHILHHHISNENIYLVGEIMPESPAGPRLYQHVSKIEALILY